MEARHSAELPNIHLLVTKTARPKVYGVRLLRRWCKPGWSLGCLQTNLIHITVPHIYGHPGGLSYANSLPTLGFRRNHGRRAVSELRAASVPRALQQGVRSRRNWKPLE